MSTMGDILSTIGGYHETCGDIMSTVGVVSTVEDIMSAVGVFSSVGDIIFCNFSTMEVIMIHVGKVMSTVKGVQHHGGTQITKDFPHGTKHPPVLMIPPLY